MIEFRAVGKTKMSEARECEIKKGGTALIIPRGRGDPEKNGLVKEPRNKERRGPVIFQGRDPSHTQTLIQYLRFVQIGRRE